jgi:hypothetical protein
MSDLLTTPELVSEPVKEPAKRWFNWWRHLCRYRTPEGLEYPVGDHPGHLIFPSKDIAESHAQATYERFRKRGDGLHLRHVFIGAYPVGERP